MFITNTEATTPRTFVAAAERVLPALQYVRMREATWNRHIFELCKEFAESAAFKKLQLVTCLGRQPRIDIWVLGPHLQLASSGDVMPENEHEYFKDPNYR